MKPKKRKKRKPKKNKLKYDLKTQQEPTTGMLPLPTRTHQQRQMHIWVESPDFSAASSAQNLQLEKPKEPRQYKFLFSHSGLDNEMAVFMNLCGYFLTFVLKGNDL